MQRPAIRNLKLPFCNQANYNIMKKIFLALIFAVAGIAAQAFSVDTVTVATKNLDSDMRVTVITPDCAGPERSVPTVYLLNGYGGDYKSWCIIQPGLGKLADQYGMLIVCPDGRDSWYFDSPLNPGMQMESFFVNDLVPYIDNNYPTRRQASQRAITGLSMGGHGGLWLGTRHPEVWGNMGSTSGGVNIMPFAEKWKIKKAIGPQETNKELWQKSTVVSLVPQMKANGQNIIFDCGSEDFFADVNADLHQRLLDAKVPHDYVSRPGKHNRQYWANSILYQLLFFNQKFNNL